MGTKIRVYHSVKRLRQSHEIHGLALNDPSSPARYGETTDEAVCETIEAVGSPRDSLNAAIWSVINQTTYRSSKFMDTRFRARLQDIVTRYTYDVVWVHFLNMMEYLRTPRMISELEDTPIVLDQHNDFEQYWGTYQKQGSLPRRIWAQWNTLRVRALREDALPICDIVISVSEEDAESTRKIAPESLPVWIAPNGVDAKYFTPKNASLKDSGPNRLVYVGSMDVSMNVDAVTWFVENILPEIQDQAPEVVFDIVGRNPTAEVQALSRYKGVRVTGRVEDVKPFYEEATIAVVPSRLGGGTKLKVTEAMATGVPVVATPTGAQGLDVEDGKHILIANEAQTFADAVVSLLENPEQRGRLIQAARGRVEDRYSWSSIYDDAISRVEEMVHTAE